MTALLDADPRELRTLAATVGLLGCTLDAPREPLEESDFAALLQACAEDRITGLLLESIETGRIPATDDQRQDSLEAHSAAMASCLRLDGFLVATHRLLVDAGITHRVLKGAAAAHLDYPDPSLRSYGDVDLLVRGTDIDATVAALTHGGLTRCQPELRPGYDRRFGKGTTLVSPEGLELDLHRTFVSGPYAVLVSEADLWADTDTFVLGGHAVQALAREARLLHACFHATVGTGQGPARLSTVRDIVQLTLDPDLDPRATLEMAGRWRAEAVVAHAVRVAWTTLQVADETTLSSWARRYAPDAWSARTLEVYRSGHSADAPGAWATLRTLAGWRERAGFLAAHLAPLSDAQGRSRHGS
ncbi:MAG: nucleotidyltransferase family protein, partial [Actinomycetes bacterium]